MNVFSFDVRSLALFFSIESLAIGFFFVWLKVLAKQYRGIILWAFSFVLLGLGYLLFAHSHLFFLPFGEIFASTIFIVSASFQLHGAAAFDGKADRQSWWFYLPPALYLALVRPLAHVFDSSALHFISSSFFLGSLYGIAVFFHLRMAKKASPWINRFIAFVFLGNALFNFLRIGVAQSRSEVYENVAMGKMPGFVILVAAVSVVLWVLGYILLITSRLSLDLTASFEKELEDRARQLRLSKRYIDLFFDLGSECLCILDLKGKILKINPSWKNELGWEEEEVLGHFIVEYQHSDDKNFLELANFTEEGPTHKNDIQCRLRLKNGGHVWLSWSLTYVRDSEIIIGSARNISAQRESEERLKLAQKEAERASWAKSQMIDSISHELRTPLNSILGFAALLGTYIADTRGRAYLDSLSSAGRSLLAVVNDLLDFTRSETGIIELRMIPFNLRQIFLDLHNVFYFAAKEKKIKFSLFAKTKLPQLVLLDIDRLRQVLINIVGNAIKFTDSGSVSVVMESFNEEDAPKADSEKKTWKVSLRFTVEDTGIGILEEYRRYLFVPFSQQDGLVSRDYGGTGLGLTIAKRLLDAMGGSISCESPIDRQRQIGSRFIIDIPHITATGGAQAEGLRLDDEGENSISRSEIRRVRKAMRLKPPISPYDELTGLMSRKRVLTHLHQEINRMQREEDVLGILICDIDRLKHINDTYGHDAGDMIIQSIAQYMNSIIKKPETLARWGGDEYCIVIPSCNWQRLEKLAGRLIDFAAGKDFLHEGQRIQSCISIGTSIIHPKPGTPAYINTNALIRYAENAVHTAKAQEHCAWEFIEVPSLELEQK